MISSIENIEPLNIFISTVIGAILVGFCFGLMAIVKASPGGFAPIGIFLQQQKVMNYGLFMFFNDFLIILFASLFFDIKRIVLSTIFIIISCVVIYIVIKLFNQKIKNY
jgi:uncharacterized membrane-anchored protein YitT (DUF2179 family)